MDSKATARTTDSDGLIGYRLLPYLAGKRRMTTASRSAFAKGPREHSRSNYKSMSVS